MPERRIRGRMDDVTDQVCPECGTRGARGYGLICTCVLKWKSEYPTQPGFYWIKNSHRGSIKEPIVVEVDSDLNVRFAGCDLLSPRAFALDAEWYGPIEPPGERKYQVCVMCGREADPRYELLHTCGPIEPPE